MSDDKVCDTCHKDALSCWCSVDKPAATVPAQGPRTEGPAQNELCKGCNQTFALGDECEAVKRGPYWYHKDCSRVPATPAPSQSPTVTLTETDIDALVNKYARQCTYEWCREWLRVCVKETAKLALLRAAEKHQP